MFLTLSRAHGYERDVREFRKQIGDALNLPVEASLLEPLPHAFYLLAYKEKGQPPVGMVEFFFYEDGFASYEDAIYSKAYDLSRIGPMHELVHVRSLLVKSQYQGSLFVHLCSAMVEIALASGRLYMTVGTKDSQTPALRLYEHAGMQRLGTLTIDGSALVLLGADLASASQFFKRLRRNRPIAGGAELLVQIQNLRDCGNSMPSLGALASQIAPKSTSVIHVNN